MDLKEADIFHNPGRHPWELVRLKIVTSLINELLKKRNIRNLNILDLGCGDLFISEALCNHFKEAKISAVDPHFKNDFISNYRNSSNYRSITPFKSLDDLEKSQIPFSLVLLLDVIEHIENDILFLRSLLNYPFINRGTVILISVPAFKHLFSSHDVFLEHFRRYSVLSLVQTVSASGYRSFDSGYFFLTLIPPRIFYFLKEKIIPVGEVTHSNLHEWKGSEFLSWLIKNILFLDFKFLRAFSRIGLNIPGLSAYCLCKKSVS